MSRRANIERHGFNHTWRGSDPTGPVDSTENQPVWGVRSSDPVTGPETEGYVLTATGDGGSRWGPATTSFSATLLGIAAAHPGALLGYWRLGEPADPWADTSGLSPDSPMTTVSGTNPLTADVTGALSATQDDGAVEFDGRSNVTSGDYIHTTANGSRFALNNTSMSVACWAKVTHDAGGSYNGVIGNFIAGGTTSRGWGIHVLQSTLEPSWSRYQDAGTQKTLVGPAMADDEWAFLVGTYDTTDGMRFYVDAALVDSDATVFNLTAADLFGVKIGYLRSLSAFDAYLQGAVDEASVWGIALTADEVLQLYNAAGVSVTLSPPAGPAGGDLAGTYPDPELATIGSATGPIGDSTHVPVVTIDAKGRVTALTSAAIAAGDPATDTKVWMPLTTTVGGDDVLVFDASHQLIPTLTSL